MPTMAEIALSCGLPPNKDCVEHARHAEALGYERVWLYDSPALYGDIWIGLARIADATKRVGLGTAVAVPSTRHLMTTASAIASVEELAPGRLACAFGSGFTAQRAMGRKALRWAYVKSYVEALRGLLRGETVAWEGTAHQMIHSPGFAPKRPIEVPLLIAPMGPKGMAVAQAIGDGVMVVDTSAAPPGFSWIVGLVNGTVLEPGEDHTSERVRAAAGPWFATSYHAIWEMNPAAVAGMPGGAEWLARIEAERPEGQRHLAVHEGHVVVVTDRDAPALDAAGPALLQSGWTGDAASVRARVEAAAEVGVTELLYTPAGPDLDRELEAFIGAARG
jgi:5,10-methylenetetrahydromethanopterin reductase